jgi:hypothetical protein
MAEQDELTTVATFSTRAEADLAQERLQGEGVDAFVMGDMAAGVMPYLSGFGILVQVPTEQAAKAREVLGVADDAPKGG